MLTRRQLTQKAYYKIYHRLPENRARRTKLRKDNKLFSWNQYVYLLKTEYSITEPDYLKLLWKTKGKCFNPSCPNTDSTFGRRLSVDHDHKTGKVRGLLCTNCNVALGQLDEDLIRIDGLKEYIRKYVQ